MTVDVALRISTEGQRMQRTLVSEQLAHWARTTPEAPAITFQDFLVDPAGVFETVTFAELDERVTVAAARLQRSTEPGDRVAFMVPQSMEYMVYFLAALRAGVIAVPVFSPDLPGHGDRLAAIVADCSPTVVLASASNEQVVRDFLRDQPGGSFASVVVLEAEHDAVADHFIAPDSKHDDLAYLQYTSGSTRLPAGVEISQGNVVANASQAILALHRVEEEITLVSWLPLFHDMGLVFVVGGVCVGGHHTVLMDPISFLIDPQRWITALASHPNTISPAPNFAYDYAASKASEESLAGLDLGNVRALGNGAEPVRPQTLQAFQDAFGPAGLRPHSIRPMYGLAEATVYVCGSMEHEDGHVGEVNRPVKQATFDLVQLSHGIATTDLVEGSTPQTMVSCGTPTDQLIAIAHPEAGTHQPDGHVGEIWVLGPNVSAGYHGRDEQTAEVFGQTLGDARGLPAGPWLRSGDLGVIHEGELFVTGRIKDLIIVGGRNHYPQDIEATVEGAHRVVGRHRTAAFAVDTPEGEAVVVVAEVSRHAQPGTWSVAEVRDAVASALSTRHNLAVHDVVLVTANEVPRTSSGKIARAATRDRWREQSLTLASDV